MENKILEKWNFLNILKNLTFKDLKIYSNIKNAKIKIKIQICIFT